MPVSNLPQLNTDANIKVAVQRTTLSSTLSGDSFVINSPRRTILSATAPRPLT